jgi:hypothetical protein
MPTIEDLAYLAGVIDGDGTIVIGKTRSRAKSGIFYPRYDLRVAVYNTDERLMLWIEERFGGHVYTVRRNKPLPNRRVAYKWTLGQRQAAILLKQVRPYLVIKAAQSDLALKFQESKMSANAGRKGGVPAEIEAQRAEWMLGMKLLNGGTHAIQ